MTWDASADAELDHYELRYSPGIEYDTEAESVVAIVAKNAPREVQTLQGLGTPGSTALFRVDVVLTTGNERGSKTVAISRP